MDKKQIKKELIAYNRHFKQMMGTFGSFEIIYDYMTFLSSNDYLQELLAPLINGLEKEAEDSEDTKIDFDKFVFDPNDLKSLDNFPFFKEPIKALRTAIEDKKEVKPMTGLPFYFISLSLVFFKVQDLKDSQKAGDTEQVKKLIEEIKEESFSIPPNQTFNNGKKFTYGQYLDMSMELVNKFLIDEIDSESLLENEKPKAPLLYNSDNYILSIRGQAIKIKLKNDLPLDHFILKCLFSRDDLFEQADFSEIAEDFVDEDYNSNGARYFRACERLNKKITKQTDNKINDFITYTTGKTGWCKINPKYL